MNTYKITVLKGDGIGPEIVDECIKVLDKAGEKFGFSFDYNYQLLGGAAIDAAGVPYPKETEEACKASDVKEVGDTYEVSGGNYKLVLDKKSGAIKSLTQDGKETTFSNADGVLWSATLRDGGKIDSSMLTCSVSERAGKLAFIYTGEDMDVQVTVSPRSKYVDFIATVTPKSRDILEFAVPARINFSPDAVSGISLQNNNPRNSGMTLNSSFFKNRSNMGMPVFKRGTM